MKERSEGEGVFGYHGVGCLQVGFDLYVESGRLVQLLVVSPVGSLLIGG